jgi:hypothetical protein
MLAHRLQLAVDGVEPGDPAYVFPPIVPLPLEGAPLCDQILADRR